MQISRPRLNYLIILGALLFYITMILLAVPTRDKDVFLGLFKVCPWTVALGYSLCYCPIIMKMFRVYYIVNNPLPNKVRIIVILNFMQIYITRYVKYQNIEDWILALGVLVFVIIDIILLLLNATITETLGLSMAISIPNRDNPRTVTGVRTL